MNISVKPARQFGIAKGVLEVPEDIDFCNDEIAELWGMNMRPARQFGIAKGILKVPENIDFCNDEIAELWGMAE